MAATTWFITRGTVTVTLLSIEEELTLLGSVGQGGVRSTNTETWEGTSLDADVVLESWRTEERDVDEVLQTSVFAVREVYMLISGATTGPSVDSMVPMRLRFTHGAISFDVEVHAAVVGSDDDRTWTTEPVHIAPIEPFGQHGLRAIDDAWDEPRTTSATLSVEFVTTRDPQRAGIRARTPLRPAESMVDGDFTESRRPSYRDRRDRRTVDGEVEVHVPGTQEVIPLEDALRRGR